MKQADAQPKKSFLTKAEPIVTFVMFIICAILMYSLVENGQRAKNASNCPERFKLMAMALSAYLEDWDNTMPSSVDNTGKADFAVFATEAGKIPPAKDDNKNTWFMKLCDYYPKSGENYDSLNDSIWCPSDKNKRQYEETKDPKTKMSYWWKYSIDAAWRGEDMPEGVVCQKFSDYAYPDKQIFLYEHSGRHDKEAHKKEGLKYGVRINVGYLDGHIGAVTLRNTPKKSFITDPAAKGEPRFFNAYSADGKASWIGEEGLSPNYDKVTDYVDPRVYYDELSYE